MQSPLTIKRAVPRLAHDSIAIIRGTGAQVMRTRDISEHGLYMFSAHRPDFSLELGRVLDVDLVSHAHSLRCKAVISRIAMAGTAEAYRTPNGFAVRLVYDDAIKSRLRGLLGEVAALANRSMRQLVRAPS